MLLRVFGKPVDRQEMTYRMLSDDDDPGDPWDDCPFTGFSFALGTIYFFLFVWSLIYLVRLCRVKKRVAQKVFLSLTATQTIMRTTYFFLWPTSLLSQGCVPHPARRETPFMDIVGTFPACFFLAAFSTYAFTFARLHRSFHSQTGRSRFVETSYMALMCVLVLVNGLSLISSISSLFVPVDDDEGRSSWAEKASVYIIATCSLIVAFSFLYYSVSLCRRFQLYISRAAQARAGVGYAYGNSGAPTIAVAPSTIDASLPPSLSNLPPGAAVHISVPQSTHAGGLFHGNRSGDVNTTDQQKIRSSSTSSSSSKEATNANNINNPSTSVTTSSTSSSSSSTSNSNSNAPSRIRTTSVSSVDDESVLVSPSPNGTVNQHPINHVLSPQPSNNGSISSIGSLSSQHTITNPGNSNSRHNTNSNNANTTKGSYSAASTDSNGNNGDAGPTLAGYSYGLLGQEGVNDVSIYGTNIPGGMTGGNGGEYGGGHMSMYRGSDNLYNGVDGTDFIYPSSNYLSGWSTNHIGNNNPYNNNNTANTYMDNHLNNNTGLTTGLLPSGYRESEGEGRNNTQNNNSSSKIDNSAVDTNRNPMRKIVIVAILCMFSFCVRSILLPILSAYDVGLWASLVAYFLVTEIAPNFAMLIIFDVAATPTAQWGVMGGQDLTGQYRSGGGRGEGGNSGTQVEGDGDVYNRDSDDDIYTAVTSATDSGGSWVPPLGEDGRKGRGEPSSSAYTPRVKLKPIIPYTPGNPHAQTHGNIPQGGQSSQTVPIANATNRPSLTVPGPYVPARIQHQNQHQTQNSNQHHQRLAGHIRSHSQLNDADVASLGMSMSIGVAGMPSHPHGVGHTPNLNIPSFSRDDFTFGTNAGGMVTHKHPNDHSPVSSLDYERFPG